MKRIPTLFSSPQRSLDAHVTTIQMHTLIVILVALVFWVAIKNTNIGSGRLLLGAVQRLRSASVKL
jgi:hypothetical protein